MCICIICIYIQIHMCIRVYISIYAYTCVAQMLTAVPKRVGLFVLKHTYAYIYIDVYMHTHIPKQTCISKYMYICSHTYVYVYVYLIFAYTGISQNADGRFKEDQFIHIYIRHTCTHIFLCSYIYICIYIYKHTRIHMYIYMYIYLKAVFICIYICIYI